MNPQGTDLPKSNRVNTQFTPYIKKKQANLDILAHQLSFLSNYTVSVIMVVFQIIFHIEMYLNNIFLFFKNYF
jgi:hypothetical protein